MAASRLPCGGGLVLWLRDLVPGAGWGLVDSSGNPKPALLALRGVLSPTAVWFTDEGLAGVGVHLANDGPEPVAAELRLDALRGLRPGGRGGERRSWRSPAHGTLDLDVEALLGRFVDASWAYRFGPPAQDAIVATLEVPGMPPADAFWFPAGPPSWTLPADDLGLTATPAAVADGVTVELESERLLYGLRVGAGGFRAEHVPSSLAPGSRRAVFLRRLPGTEAAGPLTVAALNMRGRVTLPLPT